MEYYYAEFLKFKGTHEIRCDDWNNHTDYTYIDCYAEENLKDNPDVENIKKHLKKCVVEDDNIKKSEMVTSSPNTTSVISAVSTICYSSIPFYICMDNKLFFKCLIPGIFFGILSQYVSRRKYIRYIAPSVIVSYMLYDIFKK